MFFWTAFLLGLAGSLHCAAMCGPLVLAMRMPGRVVSGRLLSNSGRIAVYVVLGAIFGLVGRTLVFAGLQNAVSIAAGVAILFGFLFSVRVGVNLQVARVIARLKSAFGLLLKKQSHGSLFVLGALNGLLPCGLVYVALAVAAASGDILHGAGTMLAFGLGTLPMMLSIGFLGNLPLIRNLFAGRRIVRFCGVMAAVLLIVRGLSLGIPYLSPSLSMAGTPTCCHAR